jgi:hypothetical protein
LLLTWNVNRTALVQEVAFAQGDAHLVVAAQGRGVGGIEPFERIRALNIGYRLQ